MLLLMDDTLITALPLEAGNTSTPCPLGMLSCTQVEEAGDGCAHIQRLQTRRLQTGTAKAMFKDSQQGHAHPAHSSIPCS